MDQTVEKEKRVRIGITHGDVNGISYEVILKTLLDQRITELYTIVVYGSSKVASYHRKALNINDFNFNLIKKADQAHPRRPNMINIHDEEIKIDLGKSTPIAGELALLSLEAAVDDLNKGLIDVVVTAPINKKNIQAPGFAFPGHTEYFAGKFHSDDYLMLMVNNTFRIGMVTGHLPISRVSEVLTSAMIGNKLKVLDRSLRRDFGIVKPRIAVLALNPHAGDDGLLGKEEQEVIRPAIEKAAAEGVLAFGPYPADGFFGAATFRNFDGILAMYHDQGMIPFKLMSFEEGVNYTAGLTVVRTAPAHGTAYELAGKDEASPEAFRNAIYMAADIHTHRQSYDELVAGQLQPGGSNPEK